MPQTESAAVFRTYLLPIQAAVTLFPLITALIIVPAAVHGYRRRGRAGGWPVLVLHSFVFYLLAALLQTVMPLPARTSAFCSITRYAQSPQLEPFDFYTRVASASGGDWSASTLAGLAVTWTTVLNAVLLLPLGVYLRYYLRQKLLPATALAFATSLFFEMTQYTGLWFVYACPYRQFNVDDLILNTGGAVLGWLAAGPLTRLLPANNPDHERVRYGGRVTFTRRLLAFVTNLAGWLITWTMITGLLAVATDVPTGRRYAFVLGSALGLVWFWLVPAFVASSPGKRAVRLRIVRPDGSRAGFFRITVRTWVAYAPLALIWLSAAQYTRDALLPAPAGPLVPYAAALAATVLWGWTPLTALLRRNSRPPHERWSDTVNHAVPGPPHTPDVSSPPTPGQSVLAAGPEIPPTPAPAQHSPLGGHGAAPDRQSDRTGASDAAGGA
ncbi:MULTISPECIES: VanZ family protein [unclassified Streptomyces]|uniref:VanZ family protein n=1 Tax=unclassified Streptomyces TaxID=2593676 RepID=UPI00073AEBE7|nr:MULTISPECIES: VanZ family protein [unclassified Streptomyces]ODA74476.1 VanZ like family protein [Streptomyces sp. AVP053U2]